MAVIKISKGVIFTYDALIASFLIIGLIVTNMVDFSYNAPTQNKVVDNYYVASDIMTLLQKYDLLLLKQNNQTLYDKIINELELESDYYKDEKKLSEIIVLSYVSDKKDLIPEVLSFLFDNMSDNFLISINGSTVYYHNTTPFTSIISSSMLPVSGYAENKAPLGYVARAYATKIETTTTLVYPIYVGGSTPALWSGYGGDYTQTKLFFIDAEDEDIINASLYFAIHYGGDEDDDISHIYINGVDVKNELVWLWEDDGVSVGAYGYVNISDYITSGWNNFSISFSNPYFHAHTHPGGKIEVLVKKRDFFRPSLYFNKTYYFDDIVGRETTYGPWGSGSGAWEIFDFYVPKGAVIHEANLYLNLKDVEDVYNNYFVPHDIAVWLNGNLIYANDNAYNGDYYLVFNISSYVKEGTNYIAVYADCYGNSFRGDGITQIYSDPLNDPYNSSRVFINYSLSNLAKYYGYIDINKLIIFDEINLNPDSQTVLLNTSASVLESLIHVVQKYSYDINITMFNHSAGATTYQVYKSQGSRDVPSSIFLEGSMWNTSGNNTFYFRDLCTICEFLPWTNAELKLMIPSFVSYGDVFENKTEAEIDAINRLKEVLGDEVDALEIVNDTLSTGNIPWMYGPILLEVKVWK